MIITHITAENFLKYTRLELLDLPRNGVITISGQNESGKSTIGETVCFALFGRTFSIADEEITRVIRWGESRCSVRLGFAIGDADYEIARFLDNDGNHGARLYPAGDEEHPFAKGINAVNEALDELLGYHFEEFVESFYLAQREITTPHPHSHAIKTMAGITVLEKAAEGLAADLKNEQRKLPDIEEQIDALDQDIKALKIEPGKLNGLENDLDQSHQQSSQLQQQEQSLSSALKAYTDALPGYKSAKSSRRITLMLAFISFILAAFSGCAWYLFNKQPDSIYTEQLSEMLNVLAFWNTTYIDALPVAVAIFSIIFLLMWLMASMTKKKISGLQSSGKLLSELARQVSDITSVIDNTANADNDNNQNSGNSSVTRISDSSLAAIASNSTQAEACSGLIETLTQQLESKIATQLNTQTKLEEQLNTEQERIARADALMGVITNLADKRDQVKHRIQLAEIADELISSAAKHFSQRFNKDLRELASRTLPLFTEDRYEHLHIGDDLSVRAFSSLKRDYMDLDEISSGTQRQIMLAVRLALSQELVNTTGSGDQFIFLDEPFAFFDETRSRNAMAILPKLSEEIKQVWVIAQSFPEDTESDKVISCSREYDSLSLSDS